MLKYTSLNENSRTYLMSKIENFTNLLDYIIKKSMDKNCNFENL